MKAIIWDEASQGHESSRTKEIPAELVDTLQRNGAKKMIEAAA